MSSFKQVYIWVEGSDDERFFKQIILPLLNQKYDDVQIVPYSKTDPIKKRGFLNSIIQMKADYIFTVDLDYCECITQRKGKIISKLEILNPENIIVVIREIESWYLAGLPKQASTELNIKIQGIDFDKLTKEEFNRLIPKRFQSSRIDFMQEILNYFNIEEAKKNNTSFKYFCDKYLKFDN